MLEKQTSPTTAMAGERQKELPLFQNNYSTPLTKPQHLNFAVYKWGKWCSVAKITRFKGQHSKEWILAMVDRNPRRSWVSLPMMVVEQALRMGVTTFYYRNDTTHWMAFMPLVQVMKQSVKTYDGVKEYVISLSSMTPEPWRAWEYARSTMRLYPEEA